MVQWGDPGQGSGSEGWPRIISSPQPGNGDPCAGLSLGLWVGARTSTGHPSLIFLLTAESVKVGPQKTWV